MLRLLSEHPLLFAVLAIASFLLFRNGFAFGPNIFGDELSYSVLARSSGRASDVDVPLVGALPNHLYFDVYQRIASLGWAQLSAARAINALFAALAVVPIYALARRFQSSRASALIAIAAVIACPGPYVSLYMPETMYVFFFYTSFVLAAYALDVRWKPGLTTLALSLCLAGLSLTKPHGLIVAGLVCASSCFSWSRTNWAENARISVTALAVLMLSVIIRQMYISFSGDAGGVVGGGMGGYRTLIDFVPRMVESRQLLQDLKRVALTNIGSTLPFVAPAAFLLLAGQSVLKGSNAKLLCMALLLWLGLLVMVIIFTVLVSVGSGENLGRIHQRYYDHALVLLCVLSACMPLQLAGLRRPVAWLAWAAMLIATLYFRAHYPISATNWIDHPLLFGAYRFPVIGSLSLAVPFIAIALTARWPGIHALRVVGVLMLPVVASLMAMTAQLRESRIMTAADRTGLAFSLVSDANKKIRVLSAGGNDSVHRMAFYLGDRADYMFFDAHDPALLSSYLSGLPRDSRLLADERLPLGEEWVRTVRLEGGFSGYERRDELEDLLAFESGGVELILSHQLPAGATGFHAPEEWGVWMAEHEALIPLSEAQSGNLNLRIKLRRLSAQLPDEAYLVICDKRIPFEPSDVMSEVELDAECSSSDAGAIGFVYPHARSPKSLGIGEDTRPLGLAVSTILLRKRRPD